MWVDEKRLALSLVVFLSSLSWRAVLVLYTSLFLDDLVQVKNLSNPWVSIDSLELSSAFFLLLHLLVSFVFLRLFLYAFLLHILSFLAVNHREEIVNGVYRFRAILSERLAALRSHNHSKTD